MLTKEIVKTYLKSDGTECPFCGSSDVNWGDFEYDGVYRKATCLGCGKQWSEIYSLVGVATDDEEIIAPNAVTTQVVGDLLHIVEDYARSFSSSGALDLDDEDGAGRFRQEIEAARKLLGE
jgi:hypothetical protein